MTRGATGYGARPIRALHTDDTVTVYHAYAPRIGGAAARTGRFPPSWKRDRMTRALT